MEIPPGRGKLRTPWYRHQMILLHGNEREPPPGRGKLRTLGSSHNLASDNKKGDPSWQGEAANALGKQKGDPSGRGKLRASGYLTISRSEK